MLPIYKQIKSFLIIRSIYKNNKIHTMVEPTPTNKIQDQQKRSDMAGLNEGKSTEQDRMLNTDSLQQNQPAIQDLSEKQEQFNLAQQ
jgi:hypothetical protein